MTNLFNALISHSHDHQWSFGNASQTAEALPWLQGLQWSMDLINRPLEFPKQMTKLRLSIYVDVVGVATIASLE